MITVFNIISDLKHNANDNRTIKRPGADRDYGELRKQEQNPPPGRAGEAGPANDDDGS